jgi:ABC-2 type transport system permease protein
VIAPIAFVPAPMPVGRVIGVYVAEAKYECLRMLRAPAFAVPFLLIPVMLYAFFGAIAAQGASAQARNIPTLLYTGFSVFGGMGPALFGFGLALALEREQGILKLKRAMPLPPSAYLLAKTMMAMLFAVITTISVAVAALLLNRVEFGIDRMAGIAAIIVIGTLPFCAIGLFIGTRVSGRAAPAVVNLVYLAMIYLSGLFIPLPPAARYIPLASPAFHLNQLCLSMAGAGSILPVTMHAAVLVGVAVLFGGLTIRRLSRIG